MTTSIFKIADYSPVKNRVYVGYQMGVDMRKESELLQLIRDNDMVIIEIPSNVIAMSASFFNGLLTPILQEFGNEGLAKKLRFDCGDNKNTYLIFRELRRQFDTFKGVLQVNVTEFVNEHGLELSNYEDGAMVGNLLRLDLLLNLYETVTICVPPTNDGAYVNGILSTNGYDGSPHQHGVMTVLIDKLVFTDNEAK